ncbi:MAG: Hsp20/alpha crystallin family protein [Proteobacteria bacterium]|nr:Hsp20/alpha crystallin family protein [Pseudomonadota bacterium]
MPDLKLWGERQLSRMKHDMDRLFEALCSDFGLPPTRPLGKAGLSVTQSESEILIRTEAPGLKPEDLVVTVTERRLVISGRKVIQSEEGVRTEQSFRREMYLPCPVEPGSVDASYEDGIVEVRLPRSCRTPAITGSSRPGRSE